ncbi:MAG TPA: hypothetical protein VGK73_01425, partial [Polyangiaceae bacterium]
MRVVRQETWSVAGAVALHAAALWLLGATLDEGKRVASPGGRSSDELSFEIELGDAVESSAPDVEVASGARVARVARSVAAPPAPEPVSEIAEPGASMAIEGEPDGMPGEQATAPRPIDLGIGPDGWQRWAKPPLANEAARADARAPRSNRFHVFRAPPASSTGGLQEGLEQRDRELGLGPTGRVISVLHKVAHGEAAPALGAARFDVTVLRTGAVEVTLGSSSGDAEKWQKVANQIAVELRAAPPRIPPPRKGVRLKVELVAEQQMPNGTKVRSFERLHLDA